MNDTPKPTGRNRDGLEIAYDEQYERLKRKRSGINDPRATKEQLAKMVQEDLKAVIDLGDSRDVDTVIAVIGRRSLGQGLMVAFAMGGLQADSLYALATAIRSLPPEYEAILRELIDASTEAYKHAGEMLTVKHVELAQALARAKATKG